MEKKTITRHPAFQFFAKHSKAQEQYAQHCFLKDLLIEAASKNKEIAVLTSYYDAFGYDLVLEYNGIIRKIQLKAVAGKAATWDIHKSLLKAESGRVVLIIIKEVNDKIKTEYLLLNPEPINKTLNTPAKVPHKDKCLVKKGQFENMGTNLIDKIFA